MQMLEGTSKDIKIATVTIIHIQTLSKDMDDIKITQTEREGENYM